MLNPAEAIGPVGAAGSVAQPLLFTPVLFSMSTWSDASAGAGFGGDGGAGPKDAPCCVAWSHSHAEMVTAAAVAAAGAPHSAWAQASTALPW